MLVLDGDEDVYVQCEIVLDTLEEYGLSPIEESYLRNNLWLVQQLYPFLETEMFSPQAKAFVKEMVSAAVIDDYTNLFQIDVFTQDPYNVWKSLSQAEKDLIKEFPLEAYGVFKNREVATQETIRRMGHNGRNDKSDAFRHAYYNVINAKVVGISMARKFSDAHESEVPPGLLKEKNMDMFNNNIGHQAINGNGSKSLNQLSNIIYQKLLDGELRYLSPLGVGNTVISTTQMIPTNQ